MPSLQRNVGRDSTPPPFRGARAPEVSPAAAPNVAWRRRALLLVLLLALVMVAAPWQKSWALPHQNGLRDTINTPVPSPTRGPTSTPSPTVAPGVQRVVLQQGAQGYEGTHDTYIDSYTPRSAPPLDGGLRIKGGEKSVLVRFDLSGHLPDGAQILDAELVFYVDMPAYTVPRALDVAAFRMLRDWDAAQASWRYMDSQGQVPWGQEGCNGIGVDRSGSADDSIALWYRAVYRGLDVTDSVRHWLVHPQENYGWLVTGVSASTGSFTFVSSRGQFAEQRPALRIDYLMGDTTPTPTATFDPAASPTLTATASPTTTPSTPTATPEPTTVSLPALQDCYIDEWFPKDPHDHGLLLCRNNGVRKALVQFDLSTLPPHAQAHSARMELTTDDTGANLIYVDAYRALVAWDETQATWQEPRAGEMWFAPGASFVGEDYVGTSMDQVAVGETSTTYSWDVTDAVRSWLSGGAENHGLLLVAANGPQLQRAFHSSESLSAASRPALVVEYSVVPPTATATRTPSHTPTPTTTPTPEAGTLSVVVFADADGDGVRDGGEEGIGGVVIRVYDDQEALTEQATTDGAGACAFSLPLGWYWVREDRPAHAIGCVSTTGDEARAYVGSGDTTVTFGEQCPGPLYLPLVFRRSLPWR